MRHRGQRTKQNLVALAGVGGRDAEQLHRRSSGAACQRRTIDARLDDRDPIGLHTVTRQRRDRGPAGHDHEVHRREGALLGGLQSGGGVSIEADLRRQRQMDQRDDVQAWGCALDLVRQSPEREPVDEDGRAVAD